MARDVASTLTASRLKTLKTLVAYGLMIGGAAGLSLLVRELGLMAVVTTPATAPMLHVLSADRPLEEPSAEANAAG